MCLNQNVLYFYGDLEQNHTAPWKKKSDNEVAMADRWPSLKSLCSVVSMFHSLGAAPPKSTLGFTSTETIKAY